MEENGKESYRAYMEEPGVDEELSERKREYEWDQYANQSPPYRRRTSEDYPEINEERRQASNERDLRCVIQDKDHHQRSLSKDSLSHDEDLKRVNDDLRRVDDDCSSYSNGSSYSPRRYRSRSRSPYSRSRSGSYERSRYRDSPRRYRRGYDRRRRSPSYSSSYSSRRESRMDWSKHAYHTVAIRYIPRSVDSADIRNELRDSRAHFIGLKMDFEGGSKSSGAAESRVCYVEFEETRDAIDWMSEHQGILRIGRDKMPMAYDDPKDRECVPTSRRDRYGSRDDDDRSQRNSTTPTDIMIVKGMDRDTTEEEVRKSFEYITHFPIQDIRLVKDKWGKPRGFCFVQWKTVDECKQVIEYLKTARPRFHILGKHVELDYSTPQGQSRYMSSGGGKSKSSSNGNNYSGAAEAAIQAAHWSRGDNQQQPPPPQKPQVSTTSDAAASQQKTNQQQQQQQAQTSVTTNQQNATNTQQSVTMETSQQATPAAPTKSAAPDVYQTPDTSKFQYDGTSGYYFDPQTRLYYDANSRYFYNSVSGQWLYWNEPTKNYVAVSAENQAKQQAASNEQKKEKEQKDKELKTKSAKKIAKDMERWAKAQNKKKEEFKRIMEDSTPTTTSKTASTAPKESATADTVFSLISKETAESERLAAVHAVYKNSTLNPVGANVGKSSGGSSNLVSYMKSSDSEDDDASAANHNSNDDNLIDLKKLACLLCRRAFPSKVALEKHVNLSNLHKQNLLKRKKSSQGEVESKTTSAAAAEVDTSTTAAPMKYRDRAAERRSKFGVEKVNIKKTTGYSRPVPYEQPTKDGLDQTNIGNKMLQKMGWKQGSGLGKTQSGIVDPIRVQQRARGAGLGMRGSCYGLDGSDSNDYRQAAKKVTMARFYEG